MKFSIQFLPEKKNEKYLQVHERLFSLKPRGALRARIEFTSE